MTLRRLLVQLCGLLLLSHGRRGETHDGIAVTLTALKLEIAPALDMLREARASQRWPATRMQPLLAAAADIEAAMIAMERVLTPRGGSLGPAGPTLGLLQRAQRRLMVVSDDRVGMAMVGFSHACCCTPIPQTASLSCR